MATSSLHLIDGVPPMPQPNDLSRSLVALDQNSTIIAVIEMSQSSWLVGGVLPGIERQPRKKLEPSPERLLTVLHRWRDEAVRASRNITRIAVAFEAGRDGFWLARWLEARGLQFTPESGCFRAPPTVKRSLRNSGAAIAGRVCYATASSAAAFDHLGAAHKRGSGAKTARGKITAAPSVLEAIR
jgi:hypothetical protein